MPRNVFPFVKSHSCSGVTDITGKPSQEWADCIATGQTPKELPGLEPGMLIEQMMDKANLSEFQRDLMFAISHGVSQVEYAKDHDIKLERVWKEKERAMKKIQQVAERMEK